MERLDRLLEVDFDFESKKEIINENGVTKWTNDFIFENEWQSFRTKDTELEFENPFRKIIKGKKIAVKVVDIFWKRHNENFRVIMPLSTSPFEIINPDDRYTYFKEQRINKSSSTTCHKNKKRSFLNGKK